MANQNSNQPISSLEQKLRKLAIEKGMGVEINNGIAIISPKTTETKQQYKARFIDGLSYTSVKPDDIFANYVLTLHYLAADLITNEDSTRPELTTLADIVTVVSTLVAEGRMDQLDTVLRINFREQYEEDEISKN